LIDFQTEEKTMKKNETQAIATAKQLVPWEALDHDVQAKLMEAPSPPTLPERMSGLALFVRDGSTFCRMPAESPTAAIKHQLELKRSRVNHQIDTAIGIAESLDEFGPEERRQILAPFLA
jgi:hypothetical protein